MDSPCSKGNSSFLKRCSYTAQPALPDVPVPVLHHQRLLVAFLSSSISHFFTSNSISIYSCTMPVDMLAFGVTLATAVSPCLVAAGIISGQRRRGSSVAEAASTSPTPSRHPLLHALYVQWQPFRIANRLKVANRAARQVSRSKSLQRRCSQSKIVALSAAEAFAHSVRCINILVARSLRTACLS